MKNMCLFWLTMLATLASLRSANAQVTALAERDSKKQDGWLYERSESTPVTTVVREVAIHLQPAARPALKIRLLPDEFEVREGNAALFYLKAGGFFEQSAVRNRFYEIHRAASASAEKSNVEVQNVPPNSYLSTAPKDLPIEEVRKYINLLDFQTFFLEEAWRLRSFSMDRNIRQFASPITYLLPEIQAMRELARNQSIRCRLAIAEGRMQDAVRILGQQFAFARHLGNDDFYVSALVGFAIPQVACNDALYLVEHKDAPNLYWALAALPNPLVELDRAHAFERQLLFEQLKPLREIDATPRPFEYWNEFVDRLLPHLRAVKWNADTRLPSWSTDDREANRVAVITFVAAAYPGAKRYLMERTEIPHQTIEAYPTAQVSFLALKLFYEDVRDEYFKYNFLSPAAAISANQRLTTEVDHISNRLGWSGNLAQMFIPAMSALRVAQARMQQRIAMLQTIEAIRMYAAEHDGQLPSKLSDLPVPIPNDPLADAPLMYELQGAVATLSGRSAGNFGYRLVLKRAVAKQ